MSKLENLCNERNSLWYRVLFVLNINYVRLNEGFVWISLRDKICMNVFKKRNVVCIWLIKNSLYGVLFV